MYTTVIDDTDFAIKPMNCPGGMLVYKTQPHSYRDLPLRVGELGPVSYTHLDVYKRQPRWIRWNPAASRRRSGSE